MITKRPSRKRSAPRIVPATARGSWPMLSTRRVLVATDGSDAARAALQFARSMEERGAWSPEVLTVLEPVPVSVAEVAFAAPSPEYQNLVTESALKRIMGQMRRYGRGDWKLDTRFGSAASSILDAATEHDAEVIVLGLGRHGRLARLFGAETAARVARRSRAVVLAVTPGAERFRTAVVAIDFGSSSIRAAREALHLLTPPAR
ncbi:MAG TPA: universal stress protein, partial [Gemmatimonadaceae bacterium]|nr:universal stress protein [Gemmatimonadaceae bacterium]